MVDSANVTKNIVLITELFDTFGSKSVFFYFCKLKRKRLIIVAVTFEEAERVHLLRENRKRTIMKIITGKAQSSG